MSLKNFTQHIRLTVSLHFIFSFVLIIQTREYRKGEIVIATVDYAINRYYHLFTCSRVKNNRQSNRIETPALRLPNDLPA